MSTIYRNTSLGIALTNTLDDMVAAELISSKLGQFVVTEFDKAMLAELERVKTKCTFKGECHNFKYCDDVWHFFLQEAQFRTNTETISVDHVKLVAVDAKLFYK